LKEKKKRNKMSRNVRSDRSESLAALLMLSFFRPSRAEPYFPCPKTAQPSEKREQAGEVMVQKCVTKRNKAAPIKRSPGVASVNRKKKRKDVLPRL
jgi:hypothetical protein